MRRIATALLSVVALAGCGLSPAVDIGAADVAGPVSPFEECVADRYAYIGENTIAGLGLDTVTAAAVTAADAQRMGRIWVTEDRLPFDRGEPGGPIQSVRMFCVEFPDGSGMSGWPVDETWQPPNLGVQAGRDPSGAPPVGMLLLAVAAALSIGISLLAFRRR